MDECKVCANADNEYCFACDNGNHFKPMTNYDLLISKTPEELTEWMCKTQFSEGDFCPPKHGRQYCIMADGCRKCWLDWLKQEVDE